MGANNDVIDTEFFPVRLELIIAVLRRAYDEPTLDQLVQRAGEVFVIGHDLVLPPLCVISVFPDQIRPCHLDRCNSILSAINLLDHRKLARRRFSDSLELRLVHGPLTPDRIDRGVRIDKPCITQPSGSLDGRVVIGRDPDGGSRLLHRTDVHADVAEMTRGVIVGDTILCPKALDQAEVIFEALYPFALEHPESIELNLTIAQSNPENELAARNDISIATASGFKFSVHTPEIASQRRRGARLLPPYLDASCGH